MDTAQEQRLEQRMADLEIRLAHHERMAEEMSEVIYAQGKTIDRLTAQVQRMRDRLEAAEYAIRSPQDDRPPPHY
ncbi:SlyX family protein [Azospirillum picis]|uniref:SlyX protein n=1 Tax=Azospirillum picis TaxID=488438 RepID=A0ABU0MTA9_9PROT|nr:SlyX family protein [Azospirillum picis]MBP2302974.1 SlyX protein [Azospirillum picis]MDQ0536726.1 SlyX protein [Azospirillum picis]